MMKAYFIILFFFLSYIYSYSQIRTHREFENIDQSGLPVTRIFQDDQELIWLCTQEGLYMYNGTKLHSCYGLTPDNLMLRCSYKIDNNRYYIGSESGLYLLDLRAFTFDLVPETKGVDVRIMALIEKDILLIGTMNGLMRLDLKEKRIGKVNEVDPYPVISISIDPDKGVAYISNNNGFFEYNLSTRTYTFIPLPSKGENSSLIHAMNYDKSNNSIWLGVEKKLYQYDLEKKVFEYKPIAIEHTINTIMVDSSGYIWVGTDQGIRTYNGVNGQQEKLIHDTYSDKYVVWAIFEDQKKNIWIGAESGLSLYKNSSSVEIFRWSNLVQSDESNRLTSLYKDTRGNFWLGGTNGLGRLAPGRQHIDWYKAGDSQFRISHNRIESIYEDSMGYLWVGTSESINRFDYENRNFVHYSIMDSSMTHTTDWCKGITGGNNGSLWIASFLGGIFKVDKEKLIKHETPVYLAKEIYYHRAGKNGLSSDRILATVMDKRGNIWASTNGFGLNKIDTNSGNVEVFSADQQERRLSNNYIHSLFCDSSGFIWVGLSGALNRINPETDEITVITNEHISSKNILSIVEKGDHLWLLVPDGLCALNKYNYGSTFMIINDLKFSCSYMDSITGKIYIGGINQCISFDPESILRNNKETPRVIFTSLFINDEPVCVGCEYEKNIILPLALSYTEEITLNHNQNNISFEVTDIRYDQIIKSQYLYRLEGIDKKWIALNLITNRISYHNLHPGKYTLTIQQTDEAGNPIAVRNLIVYVLPPWYATTLAKILYAILFLSFFAWIINYFRVKNKLKIAHVEKEKALELSAMKIEFLSNISHELKTPLSLIISPANKLLTTIKNNNDKKLMQIIQQNAMRLSSLVNQMVDSKNIELSPDNLFLSQLEIVEFCKSILRTYQEAFNTKKIDLKFDTNINLLSINVDILKLESILNNLISNAYKFTAEGNSVVLKLNYVGQGSANPELIITVSDTGIGIPEKDIPYIFNRFYQSDTNAFMNKDGSGIGLSMVKKYVEVHNGTIKAISEEQKGTSIIFTLPIIEVFEPVLNTDTEEVANQMSGINILIVEDNVDIARFIKENLNNANCIVAHNGNSGYKMALEYNPDIIISDVMMPVMGGIDMSRLLKQNIITATIPIILLTAKNDKQTENLAYSYGVDAFISKPFDIKQLILRIEQIRQNKLLLISKIKQNNIIEDKDIENVPESQDEKLLKRITQIIEEHLSDPDLNVQKLSEISEISSKQIYRRIKLLTGNTTVDYIKSIRLKKAVMLMSQQKFSISEIMYMVGFSHASYFTKCFSEKYGKTPKQYMESL